MRMVIMMSLAVLVALCLGGCFASNPKDMQAFLKPEKHPVSSPNYVLSPPDEVQLKCSKISELNDQKQIIRPDGKISFQGIGDIYVAGKTVEQVSDLVRQRVESLYNLPGLRPVDIQVTAFNSQYYYVLGEVYFPGKKDYTGRDSVIAAVAQARPTVLAWDSCIQIVRPSSNPLETSPKIYKFNLRDMRSRGDGSKNMLLQQGDIIYVPPTVLAAIGKVVEELLSPIGRAFSTVNIVQGPAGYR